MTTTPDRRYETGETFHLQVLNARVVRHSDDDEVFFDYAGPDGATLRGSIFRPSGSKAVTITPVLPAAGEPKPGQIWTNAEGRRWIAYGKKDNPGLMDIETAQFRAIHEVHRESGPIWPVYTPEDAEPELKKSADWYYTSDDLHHIVHDPDGNQWDLSMNFVDAQGFNWYWDGAFTDPDTGAKQPLMNRSDGTRYNAWWSEIPGLKYAPEA
ncbi:hypothetical protein [Microbispora sp. NPDC049633]|uniref:hypothetical protein n=1 Tax=Microbispora sp. NPDC049633 TaxID=3154355 RepID=UPI00343B2748